MKTFGMLLLVALSTSPTLARHDDQNTSEVGGGMLREAWSDIRARSESDDRMFTEGVQTGRCEPVHEWQRVKNEKPLPKKVGASQHLNPQPVVLSSAIDLSRDHPPNGDSRFEIGTSTIPVTPHPILEERNQDVIGRSSDVERILRSAFGLTQAEARLAISIMNGEDLETIAAARRRHGGDYKKPI